MALFWPKQLKVSGENAYWTASGGEIHRIGNVGIGTTAPEEQLHVWNDVSASAYYGNGSNLTGISGQIDWAFGGAVADMYPSPRKFLPADMSASAFLATCDSGSCYIKAFSANLGEILSYTYITGSDTFMSSSCPSSSLSKDDRVYIFISESRNCYNLSVTLQYSTV